MPWCDSLQSFQTTYQQRVHGPDAHSRARVIAALDDFDGPGLSKRASKLRDCCKHATLHWDEDDQLPYWTEARCKSRLCPRCARIRARAIIPRIIEATSRLNSPKLLTLTVTSNDDPLRDRVKHLTESFKRLRRSRLWKQNAEGGVYTIETTWNYATSQWHPHLHAVIDSAYIPQSALADAWQQATGDSKIVDIRAINDRRKVARYVAGYIAKSSDVRDMPDHCIPEWAQQLHGMRMLQTFGSLHGVRLQEDHDETEWTPQRWFADLGQVADAADRGDPDAATIISATHHPETGLPRRPPDPSNRADAARVAALLDSLRSWSARQKGPPDPGDTPHGHDPPRTDYGGLWTQRDGQDGDSAGGHRSARETAGTGPPDR